MRQSAHGPMWLDSLPVGGEDGTLSERFRATADGRRIRAKTGTLGHVSAMSGYARTKSGDELAFAVLVNNYASNASEIRGLVDRICMLMVQ
jgi:D-alanyl-D-alanine carboxypeptidase/D-alanyl-D-alanine-endopeptidase (penicillin-binding protein 4)